MRSIFITGGASGIGLAAAKRFSREGWIVGIGDIDETGRRRAAEELNIMSFPLNPRDCGHDAGAGCKPPEGARNRPDVG